MAQIVSRIGQNLKTIFYEFSDWTRLLLVGDEEMDDSDGGNDDTDGPGDTGGGSGGSGGSTGSDGKQNSPEFEDHFLMNFLSCR